jgi:hypothetical protein
MYTLQDLFDVLSTEEIYYTLKPLVDGDCYVEEFLDKELLEQFLNFLILCNVVWLASDNRVLLTESGEKVLNTVTKDVELNSKSYKIKKKNYGKK